MGFFSSIGNVFKKIGKAALPVLGSLFGGGLLGGLLGGKDKGDGGIGAMQATLQADAAKQKKETEQAKQTEERRLSTLKSRTRRGSRRSLLFTEGDKGLSETLA